MSTAQQRLTVALLDDGRRSRLVVTGEIDLATVDQFDAALNDALSERGRLILDLTKADFLASSGIRVLALHAGQLAAVLVRPGGIISRALSISGLHLVVEVNPDPYADQPQWHRSRAGTVEGEAHE